MPGEQIDDVLAQLVRSRQEVATWKDAAVARMNERDAARREIDGYDVTLQRLDRLLTGVAAALKGEPDKLTMHSWHDLPELAAAAVKRADEWMRKCQLAQKRADEAERMLAAEREIAEADRARAAVQIRQWEARSAR